MGDPVPVDLAYDNTPGEGCCKTCVFWRPNQENRGVGCEKNHGLTGPGYTCEEHQE